MAVVLKRNPMALITGWHLVDLAAMGEAFSSLTADGWRGGIKSTENGAFCLELNASNPDRHIEAQIGDWLIKDIGLRLFTAEECSANYEEVEAES